MATDIIRRSVKGSALTHAEMDQNLESLSMTVDTKTANYTILVTDQNKLIEMNGISITLTLCTVAVAAGADTDSFLVWVKNIHTSSCTVDGNGAETIDGAASITLLENEGVLLSLAGGGTEWTILAVTNPGIIGFTGVAGDLNVVSGGAAAGVSATEFQYLNGVTSAIQTQITARLVAASNLSDVASVATSRTNLGLDTMATQASGSVSISGGTITNVPIVGGSHTGMTDIAIADGGTAASTESAARTNLGVAIGSDVQAFDGTLSDLAALAVTDGNFIVGNGVNFVAESDITARASLGLDALAVLASVDQGTIDNAAVGRGELITATATTAGSITAGSSIDITLNPYSFFPMIHVTTPGSVQMAGHSIDGASADNARFGFYNSSGSGETYDVDHRYVGA